MLHTIVVTLHVVGAIGGLIMGFAAFVFPNGTAQHRAIGKTYLLMWALIAITGYALGADDRSISPFEIATTFGAFSTVYAYAMVLFRQRIGRTWLVRHYNWMLASMAALLVATVNQTLPRLGIEYPIWVFILMCVSPTFIIPFFARRLDRRYGAAR